MCTATRRDVERFLPPESSHHHYRRPQVSSVLVHHQHSPHLSEVLVTTFNNGALSGLVSCPGGQEP